MMIILNKMASPRGFEPLASGLGILRSILLSYGDYLAFIEWLLLITEFNSFINSNKPRRASILPAGPLSFSFSK
jgi:hypothetical protein